VSLQILRLRQKLKEAGDSVKGMFGFQAERDPAVDKLEQVKANMEEARQLFRDPARTEFIIVAIPTIMAANESARLAKSLKEEHVPVRKILINQVIPDSATMAFLNTRRKDQEKALAMLAADPGLGQLQLMQAPLFDLEVRGLPALQYFGDQIWK